MSENLVITIGRTFGSGGREIGKKLAEELEMAYFDKELLEEVVEHSGLDAAYLKLFDEKKPPLTLFSSAPIGVPGEERRMEVRLQTLQHEVIERLVAKTPCVFVGRKTDQLLRNYSNVHNIFITAPLQYCARRVSVRDELTMDESIQKILRMNRSRKYYYNYTGDGRWGEASNYGLCIDSSKLGVDGAVQLIKTYVELNQQGS